MNRKNKRKIGFTLLEVIISVAIVIILFTIILASYSSFRLRQTYSNTLEEAVAFIEKARSFSLSSRDGGVYGVHFSSVSMTRFRGPIYTASDPANEVFTLDTSITLSNISLIGGGADILFQKITGGVVNYGTTTLTQSVSPVRQGDIVISRHGIIEVK